MRISSAVKKALRFGIFTSLKYVIWQNKVLPWYYKLNFYLCNLNFFLDRKIKLGKGIQFSQKVVLNGGGNILIGEKTTFGYCWGGYTRSGYCEIQPRLPESSIEIGSNCNFNNNTLICIAGRFLMGDNALIGHNCEFLDFDAHEISAGARRTGFGRQQDITIGNNVWIGNYCIITKGTKIGDNSIVSIGSVVKGEFPDNVIIGGNPAKIIKNIN